MAMARVSAPPEGMPGSPGCWCSTAPQPLRPSTAALTYHAIAFWIPSIGGIAGYARPRCRLRNADGAAAPISTPRRSTTPSLS